MAPATSIALLDTIRKFCNKGKQSVANSIQKSSQRTYSSGVRRWFQFVKEFGTDPFMRTVPREFFQYKREADSFHHTSWQEACFMGFLEWLQGPPKPIAPSSASNYLYAVKHHLMCHGLDVSSRVSSVVLSKQKKGQVNTFLEDEHNLESNRRTLPLSVDILMGEVPGPHSKSPLQDRTFYTALMLGFTMLARASNYLPIASATYHLNTEHIAFTVAPAPGTIGAPVEVTADSLGEIPLSRIIGASAFLTRSKVDNTGKGKHIPFLRQTVNPPVCVYDIVTVLYQYVLAARPVRGKPFFYVPSLHWSLTPVLYNQRLRGVAIKHGLDPDRVHSHSVRIGGATLLAAAGVPDYIIMAMGGWASAVYLQYIRPALQLYAAAQVALANATFLSADSIRAVHSHQKPGPTYDRDRFTKAPDDAFKPSVLFAGILDL
jgi:hypothetical protein